MIKRVVVIAALAISFMMQNADAFDGERRGFILGGGLGYAAVSSIDYTYVDESEDGAGANFIIGHAWDNKNMVVFEFNGLTRQSDYFGGDFSQFFAGPAWYHYFSEEARGLFAMVGIGRYVLAVEDGWDEHVRVGIGYLIGGGFEFSKQVQVGGYISGGKTRVYDNVSSKAGLFHINLLITVVAY